MMRQSIRLVQGSQKLNGLSTSNYRLKNQKNR